MIARIESNCTTGEVKYFDENEVEIQEPTPVVEAQITELISESSK